MSKVLSLDKIDEISSIIDTELPKELHKEFFEYCNVSTDSPYENPPVDMETFLTDDYYCGKIGKSLWPVIKDDLIEFFEGDYIEALLTGSTRSGKSFFASFTIVRLLYLLSCYLYPQDVGNLARSSMLYIINLSVTGRQAIKGVYLEVVGIIDNSPYFKEEFAYDPRKTSELSFPKRVTYFPGNSTKISTLGLNPFGGCLDEITSMKIINNSRQSRMQLMADFDAAHELWEAFYRRVKDTFTIRGKFFGRMVALGSREYPNDWMDRRIEKYKDDPQTFIRVYAQPETKPKKFFLPEYFYVDCGAIGVKPKIVQPKDYENNGYTPAGKMLKTPMDYYRAFTGDIYGALKDIWGLVLRSGDNALFGNPDDVYKCFQRKAEEHPMTATRTTLRDGVKIIRDKLVSSNGLPLVNPNKSRFLHIDQGKTSDTTGFVMGHVYKMVPIEHLVEGKLIKEMMPMVYIDLALEIVPEKGNHVDTTAIRNLVYDLIGIGFKDIRVSFDGVGQESMHRLRENGVSSEYMSVDRTVDPYTALYDAIIEGRVSGYVSERLIMEMTSYLVWTRISGKDKIDHIASGSKDMADSLAAIVYRCLHEGSDIIAEPVVVKSEIVSKEAFLQKESKNHIDWLRGK